MNSCDIVNSSSNVDYSSLILVDIRETATSFMKSISGTGGNARNKSKLAQQ
jgi:hypothetical protein